MIAKIIVDISNSSVDRCFDYLTVEGVEIGSRVLVPFGPRQIEGYCIGLSEKSDYPAEKLKTVAEVLDDYPVVLSEMIALMRYMTEKYRLRIVDMLRLFLPAEMRSNRVKPLRVGYAALDPAVDPAEKVRASAFAQLELVEYLRAFGSARVADLNRNFSAAALRALVAKGVVTVSKERLMRTPYRELGGEADAHELLPAQTKAYDAITGSEGTFLLHGVTGSGKTEVYINVILDCLRREKTAIMLVPEISLTPQVLRLFRSRFGSRVALLHSGLSAGERFDEWTRLREGAASIAVGARSAIFAPLQNLGAIIVDEEHDSSYIAEDNPRYDTHEIAAFRARFNRCPLVLGSATPSVDSYWRAKNGLFTLLEMPERVNRRSMPAIRVVDMTREVRLGNASFLSVELQTGIKECLAAGHQAILFLNRRGYASYQQCRACGYVVKCDDCDVPMVYHREENRLKCHYCNARREPLVQCPECGSVSVRQGAMGTERVVAELMRLYPGARVLRMDNDTTKTKDAHSEILSKFAAHEADILVGTQMVAKGHDFGECTLVGILEADLSLYVSDYRAVERTFQLITQVAGRAGRAEHEGSVVLQTYSPRHYVFKYACDNDYLGFYEREINVRETTKFPPFSTVVRVMVTGENEDRAVDVLHGINDEIKAMRESDPASFLYFKAMRAPLKKLQAKYRVQIIARLRGARTEEYVTRIAEIVESRRAPDVTSFLEVNPQNLR